MDRKKTRRQRTKRASEATPAMPDINRLMLDPVPILNVDDSVLDAGRGGELAGARGEKENSEILLAACGIVINGYKAEMSRGQHDSLFVQAAYQLLHHFLERQFNRTCRAA